MTVERAWLEVDGDRLDLVPRSGVWTVQIDPGHGEARRVQFPRAGRDGVIDETRHVGARAVTVQLVVPPSDEGVGWWLDRLARFADPAARPRLVWRRRGQSERMMRLAADQWSQPWTSEIPGGQRLVLQWQAPDGVAVATTLSTQTTNPAGDVEGREYPLTFDRSYPESQGPGRVEITNAGSAPAYPCLRIYGPCEDPIVENETVGARLQFDGLTVAAGDYIEADAAEQTITLNGVSDRYQFLDVTVSDWWPIKPGTNLIRFAPDSSSPPCELQVRWRDAHR